jgi:hypothetical protein
VLGHKREGVRRVYNRSKLPKRKAEALQRLADEIERIAASPRDVERPGMQIAENVVRLPVAAAG